MKNQLSPKGVGARPTSFRFTFLSLLCCLVVVVLNDHQARASVSRETLKTQTRQQAEAELVAQLKAFYPTEEPSTKEQNRKKIRQRVAEMVSAIDALPMAQVNDALARWIKESIVEEISALSLAFLSDPDPSKLSFDAKKKQAIERFRTLSNVKGETLLRLRARLMSDAKVYQREVRAYIYNKISQHKNLKMDTFDITVGDYVDLVVKYGSVEDRMAEAIESIHKPDASPKADTVADKDVVNTYDFRASPIDFRLLNLVMVRWVEQRLQSMERIDYFSFNPIFSIIYAEGDPRKLSKPKTFTQVKPFADKFLTVCLQQRKGFVQMDNTNFNSFLGRIFTAMRWEQVPLPAPETLGQGAQRVDRDRYILIEVDPSAWKLILRS